jgi:flavin reductase (DIM6/NTAB) family NADH-FMN oxidoreductase RutF
MEPILTETDGEKALARLAARTDTPMAIVTATTPDGRRSGCLVGFWTQCSISPPRLLACISKANHTFDVARDAAVFAVHWLGTDNRDLAELFGGETGDSVDKFERCTWHPGPGEVPVLDGVKGWVAGRVVGRFDGGDHVGFVVGADAGAADEPSEGELGFLAVKDLEPGHKP